MNRLVIVIATAIVIVSASLIIFIVTWGPGADDVVFPPPPPPPPIELVQVSINAIPWARVFIKLPESDDFIVPRAQDYTIPNRTNVTPIRVRVPADTTIKLVYEEKEKIFPYQAWKDEETISQDFLNQ